MDELYINFKNGISGGTPLNATNLNLLQQLIKEEIHNIKLDTIKTLQNFSFYDNGNGVLGYNLQGLCKNNLVKVEIGYTENERLTFEPTYQEVTNYNYAIQTDISADGNVYVWIRLTYSDIGVVELISDNNDNRYSIYMSFGGALACFTSDTLILTNDGLKEISKLDINDKVMTANGLQKITKMYKHVTDKIYKISIGDTIIKASYSHPFPTIDKGIIMTKDLVIGDKLYSKNGDILEITNIEVEDKKEIVYEINTNSKNYYITDKNVLVASEKLL